MKKIVDCRSKSVCNLSWLGLHRPIQALLQMVPLHIYSANCLVLHAHTKAGRLDSVSVNQSCKWGAVGLRNGSLLRHRTGSGEGDRTAVSRLQEIQKQSRVLR